MTDFTTTQEEAVQEDIRPLETPEEIVEALGELGYSGSVVGNAVITKIGNFAVSLSKNDEGLRISCQITVMGQIPEDRLDSFVMAALGANATDNIKPYAFAVITDSEDPDQDDPEEWPVILTDTIPDITQKSIEWAMDQLVEAMTASKSVLSVAFGE